MAAKFILCAFSLCTLVLEAESLSRDPCLSFICCNGGYCTSPLDIPYCVCPPCYTGAHCETKITNTRDPCLYVTCYNGGYCTAPADAPYCVCPPGYTGANCETEVISRDPCLHFICYNGGYCTAPADAPYCVCPPGYTGANCETEVITRDPCLHFICCNGGYCTAPADAPYCVCPHGYSGINCQTKTNTSSVGLCPDIIPGSAGVCGGQFCSVDSECPSGQICCASACGGKLCTFGTPGNGAVCPGGCPEGYTCEFRPVSCKPGVICLNSPVPTCVPVPEKCGGCPAGQTCVEIGTRCPKTTCPTYQCRPKATDQCGGCPDGQECVDTGIRCATTPCPSFKCVTKPSSVCNLFCAKGYKCVIQVPPCDPSSTDVCSTTPVAQCVPVLASCPKPGQILDPRSRACRRVVSSCQTDADCDPQSQRCCPNRCNKLTCTKVPRL